MTIEQSIYTHTKVRRDTHSTGFGYYSLTPGMDKLFEENRRLAAASMSYIAPRNSELWWEQEETDISRRDELEAERIRRHHPESFAYRLFDTASGKISALTYGRNLGRDLSPLTRDGNILVNTLAADPAALDRYPYEYYGSPALFLDCERGFFLNAPDGEPAPDLDNPADIPAGTAPDPDDVAQFICDEDRLPLLRSMLNCLMKINDGGSLKRIIICDRKENLICWTAALSLVYPRETALGLTFSTYSFLGGNPDDFSPAYDDVMLCGVYTPTVNGDPASRRTTNYEPSAEQANSETALFDLEQGIFPEDTDENAYFGVFIESAFETDLRLIDSYKDFIAERTSCRTLGSDYARGYGYFTITRLKNEYSLRYIADAVEFAKKYMTPADLKELLDVAFACGFDSEEAERLFGELLEAAGSAADGGFISAEEVAESSAEALLNCFRKEETSRVAYYGLKNQLEQALGRQGIPLERAFLGRLPQDELESYCTAPCKRWRLAELAGMISRHVSGTEREAPFGTSKLERTLLRISRRLLISEKNDRSGLMSALLDGFSGDTAISYFCAVFRFLADKPEIRAELGGCLGRLCLRSRGNALAELIALASKEDILDSTVESVTEAAAEELTVSERAGLFSELIRQSGGRLDSHFESFERQLCPEEERSPESIYIRYEFTRDAGRLDDAALTGLVNEYYRAAAEVSGRYSIDEETGQRLLEMTASASDPAAVLYSEDSQPELASVESLIFAKVFAEERSVENMYPAPETLTFIDFGGMTEAERAESVRELGNAFCRRSMALGSALVVEYGYFIDTGESRNDRLLSEIFAAWAEELATIRPAEYLRLTGQVIAISSPFMRGGLLIGNLLFERHITPDEIRPYVFEKNCLKALKGAAALGKLEKLMDEITAIYESRAVKSPFGKIRSKLGNTKKKK